MKGTLRSRIKRFCGVQGGFFQKAPLTGRLPDPFCTAKRFPTYRASSQILKGVILFTLILCLSTNIMPGKSSSVNGYYKLFFTGFKMPGEAAPVGSVNNRLRLKLSLNPAEWLSIDAAYDISPRIQDPMLFSESLFYSAIDPLSYRVDDFDSRLYPAEGKPVSSIGVFHNLDRLFVTIKTGIMDIFIGRQAIAWGSAKVINPTDVVAPFTFNELDTEERRGVDAVRVRIPLGMMDELDMGYIPGKDFKIGNSAFYLRGKTYFLKTDLSMVLMGFRENFMAGIDIARSVGGAGVWCEAAYVVPGLFEKEDAPGKAEEKDYFRASVGVDYNFNGKFYGFFEYHFNSAGESEPGDYNRLFTRTAYREGADYLMGKHYLNVGATCQVTPLIPVTGLLIFNVNDRSLTFAPTIEYNIKEDIYIAAGAYLGIGKHPEIIDLNNPSSFPRFHSEFGSYPNMFFTSFRIYF
jgi:hypothetical protein